KPHCRRELSTQSVVDRRRYGVGIDHLEDTGLCRLPNEFQCGPGDVRREKTRSEARVYRQLQKQAAHCARKEERHRVRDNVSGEVLRSSRSERHNSSHGREPADWSLDIYRDGKWATLPFLGHLRFAVHYS